MRSDYGTVVSEVSVRPLDGEIIGINLNTYKDGVWWLYYSIEKYHEDYLLEYSKTLRVEKNKRWSRETMKERGPTQDCTDFIDLYVSTNLSKIVSMEQICFGYIVALIVISFFVLFFSKTCI